jgi:hypothetical protein
MIILSVASPPMCGPAQSMKRLGNRFAVTIGVRP